MGWQCVFSGKKLTPHFRDHRNRDVPYGAVLYGDEMYGDVSYGDV
jgi:hypothetical protein